LAAPGLEIAYDAARPTFGLTIADRDAILGARDDCPDELIELRTVLMNEYEWRRREGL
jgi:hypothetical protein